MTICDLCGFEATKKTSMNVLPVKRDYFEEAPASLWQMDLCDACTGHLAERRWEALAAIKTVYDVKPKEPLAFMRPGFQEP